MALINCPECGKQISNKAPSCIHCGYPIGDDKTVATADSVRVVKPDTMENVADQEVTIPHKIPEITMPQEPSRINPPLILAICTSLAYVFLISIAIDPSEALFSGLSLFLLAAIVFMFFASRTTYTEKKKEYERAKSDFEKYKAEEEARIAAIYDKFDAMQKAREEEKIAVENKRREARIKGIAACPHCGSTAIVTMHRGYSAFWGAIGSAEPVNVCQACGHKFKPGT